MTYIPLTPEQYAAKEREIKEAKAYNKKLKAVVSSLERDIRMLEAQQEYAE